MNPNDLETPEEREDRMRLVRQIQQSFYQGESEGLTEASSTDITILENVPLWRVQWTELPGYQNVLNCHVPHYTHMFRRILSGPKPWLFGHVYLPGGSENLNNPKYSLPAATNNDNQNTPSDATLTGTLMQISDYEQLEDGRLALIVQALDRFQIQYATQHVPYAIATIQLDPDYELVENYMDDAAAAHDVDLTAARVAAVQEAKRWRDWEFRPTTWDENKSSTTTASASASVSPLVNYDANFELQQDIQRRNEYLTETDDETTSVLNDVEEKHQQTTDTVDFILQLEYKVWVAVDQMLRLLALLNPGLRIPVPSQMLGLLPLEDEGRAWPTGFRLQEYANELQSNNAMIGTSTKSPFVRVSSSKHKYPPLRRATRLSYAVWILLDSIVPSPKSQVLLEETSIARRLEYALRKVEGINDSLQEVVSKQ